MSEQKENGIDPLQLSILEYVWSNRRASRDQLALFLGLHKRFLSKLLADLFSRGLIWYSDDDSKHQFPHLTEKGGDERIRSHFLDLD